MGDCNINYLETDDPKTKKLKDTMRLLGLKQHINEPTYFGMRHSCLDLIFSNSDLIDNSGTFKANISDHDMIYITRHKNKLQKHKIAFTGRSYKKYDKEQFTNLLLSEKWDDFDQDHDINDAWNLMYSKIKRIIDKMCPMKKFNISKRKDPWITNELLEIINDKNSQMDKAKRTKKPEDSERARFMRNECNRLVRKARARYIQEQAENYSNDPKAFWRNIRDVLPNSKVESSSFKLVDHTKKPPINDDETATFLINILLKLDPN